MVSVTVKTAENVFNAFFKYKRNFVTPTVICYRQKGNRFAELSTGMIMGSRLYGVTILEINNLNEIVKPDGLADSFTTEEEAMNYMLSVLETI